MHPSSILIDKVYELPMSFLASVSDSPALFMKAMKSSFVKFTEKIKQWGSASAMHNTVGTN